MFFKDFLYKPVNYYDTILISIILSVATIPSLWYISQGNLSWVVPSSILWTIGVFTIFHPTVRFIFPWLLTKVGTLSLTFILAVLSIWLNGIVLGAIISYEDIELIMSKTLYGDYIGVVTLFVWFYVVIAGALLSNIKFRFETIALKHREIIASLSPNRLKSSTLLEHFLEVLFIFILPIILMFWIDITYSFRVLLAFVSIIIGVYIYIHSLGIKKRLEKLSLSMLSLFAVLTINGGIISIFGLDNIPAKDVKNSIYLDYQFSDNRLDSKTVVYNIVASVPEIALYIGHRVATIPNREITIESSNSQYTVYDEYNKNKLLTLEK